MSASARRLLLLLLLPLLALSAADGLKPLPRGIINSAGPSFPGGRTQSSSAPSSLAHVGGTLVRLRWADVQPAEQRFDWSLLDAELAASGERGKRIHLMILDGDAAPAWLKERCQTFDFRFRGSMSHRICLPWDAGYLAAKQRLVEALAAHVDDDERVVLVYITYAAMSNGAEMHFRISPTEKQALIALGYSDELLSSSYNTILGQHLDAFRRTPVAMEVHAVFDSDFLARKAWAFAQERAPGRLCVAAWWACERLTTGGEAAVYPIWQAASRESCAIVQFIGNFSEQAWRFEPGARRNGGTWTALQALQHELPFWQQAGATAYEVWTKDLANTDPTFRNELLQLADALDAGAAAGGQ